MAYANWLSPSKLSGNGNDTVNVSALSDNTGRASRTTTVTFKAANCEDVERTVTQAGKPEFVNIQSTAAVSKSGGTLTITGTSNSKKLTFSLGSGATLNLTLPESYTAAGETTTNGSDITGDPGNSQEYAFSVTFTGISENETISTKSAQVIVTPDGGSSLAATCTVTQAEGDATLSVSPASVSLAWNAYTESGSQTFTVTSNTNWTVE